MLVREELGPGTVTTGTDVPRKVSCRCKTRQPLGFHEGRYRDGRKKDHHFGVCVVNDIPDSEHVSQSFPSAHRWPCLLTGRFLLGC